jgi:hypothetical protein
MLYPPCMRRGDFPHRWRRSEVTLGTELQQKRILVLELIESCRLGGCRCKHRTARHLLVEVEPLDFGRERQILDGSPAGNHAKLGDVEVRITSIGAGGISDHGLTRMAGSEGGTIGSLGGGGSQPQDIVVRSSVISYAGVASEQAGRPVRIPVVVERTADTPKPS